MENVAYMGIDPSFVAEISSAAVSLYTITLVCCGDLAEYDEARYTMRSMMCIGDVIERYTYAVAPYEQHVYAALSAVAHKYTRYFPSMDIPAYIDILI